MPSTRDARPETRRKEATHVKVGISCIITPRDWTWRETFEKATAAGYEAIELVLRDNSELDWDTPVDDIRAIRQMAADFGLELDSLCPQTSKRIDLMSGDPAVRAEGKDRCKKLLEIARQLGIDGVLVVPGSVTPEIHYDDGYARALEGFCELAPFAEDIGVTLAIEYVWNKFLLSPLEWKRFLDEIGSDRVGLFFDTGNMTIFGFPEQWVKIVGKGVKKVHFKDFKRMMEWKPLLQGDVDFPAVMRELRNIGFDGVCLSEVDPGLAPIEETAATIRQILEM
ncbi:MAG: sugar phosphate isomerase/epimerase [Armatimonadetes bacterium]|nr:sugar phosphate isomerase/epimerase [Armatimonadota bacterium]